VNNNDGALSASGPADELRRVDIVGGGGYVREYRLGAERTHGTAVATKVNGGRITSSANADAAGAQGENESIGAGTYAEHRAQHRKNARPLLQRSAFAPQDKLLPSEQRARSHRDFAANDRELAAKSN